MTKHQAGLFSFEARGTIADSLTFHHETKRDYARRKPIPAYRRTLPQTYQRWLYEDYVAWWHQQSVVTKATWETNARPHHMTGFAYWMKDKLTTLPDIAIWLKLDEMGGNVAHDSSRNLAHGTFFGGTPSPLTIDGGRFFDDLDDIVLLGNPSALANMTVKSMIIFLKPTAFHANHRTIYYAGYWHSPYGDNTYCRSGADKIRVSFKNTLGTTAYLDIPYTPDLPLVIGYTWDGTQVYFYKDGIVDPTVRNFTGILSGIGAVQVLGARPWADYYGGHMDNFIVYNRALAATDHLRWAERRYP